MSLTEYKRKRHMGKTPEPKGGRASKTKLHFVVQKHAASQLHYDFRLEMSGVLKSWAVPKGPSMNPADKRLAIQVEDHPYDYKDFEGTIPEGNYGAGTVIVWDQGTYESLGDARGKAAHTRILLEGLQKGTLKVRLDGQKLKGEFVLVRTSSKAKNTWLLIKHRDEFASQKDIRKEEGSVLSGKTVEVLAEDPQAKQWKSSPSPSRKPATAGKAVSKKGVRRKTTTRGKR